jgi:alpha-galactosidase
MESVCHTRVVRRYMNLDDCYVRSRLPNGTLVPDPVSFPSGMRALADYVHSRDMLFGVYTARCAQTCDKRPGSMDHEAVDAHTFAIDWDVDYLKEDSCTCSGRGGEFKSIN